MDEDTELVNSPTARNDYRWNLNSQGLTPEPMTTTLHDVTSPKEMWEGLSPGLPQVDHRWPHQVACQIDRGRHQWGETVFSMFHLKWHLHCLPRDIYHAGQRSRSLISATLSPGRRMLCKASAMVLVWGKWNQNLCSENRREVPCIAWGQEWREGRRGMSDLHSIQSPFRALSPSIYRWNWITNH